MRFFVDATFWPGSTGTERGVGFLRYKKDEQQGWKRSRQTSIVKESVILLLDNVDEKDPATVLMRYSKFAHEVHDFAHQP